MISEEKKTICEINYLAEFLLNANNRNVCLFSLKLLTIFAKTCEHFELNEYIIHIYIIYSKYRRQCIFSERTAQ